MIIIRMISGALSSMKPVGADSGSLATRASGTMLSWMHAGALVALMRLKSRQRRRRAGT